jgi:hypothetical protein
VRKSQQEYQFPFIKVEVWITTLAIANLYCNITEMSSQKFTNQEVYQQVQRPTISREVSLSLVQGIIGKSDRNIEKLMGELQATVHHIIATERKIMKGFLYCCLQNETDDCTIYKCSGTKNALLLCKNKVKYITKQVNDIVFATFCLHLLLKKYRYRDHTFLFVCNLDTIINEMNSVEAMFSGELDGELQEFRSDIHNKVSTDIASKIMDQDDVKVLLLKAGKATVSI